MSKELLKNLILFGVVGPFVGFAVFASKPLLISLSADPIANSAETSDISALEVIEVLLSAAYAVGILPALAAGSADSYFSKHQHRRMLTSSVGFLAGFVLASLLLRRINWESVLVGISAATAAFVCSSISQALASAKRVE